VLLKEVPLRVATPLDVALSADGERVALLNHGALGLLVELRSAADGTLLSVTPVVAPWWTVERRGPHGAATLGFGTDVLAVADEGGVLVVPLGADGTLGEPIAFPSGAEGGGVSAVRHVCDGAVVVDGPSGVTVLRRAADGWRAEPAGRGASLAACTAGGTVVALARDDGLEVRSPAGSDAVASSAVLVGALLVGGGAGVELLQRDGSGAILRTSVGLTDFAATTVTSTGEFRAFDPASGELLWLGTDGLRLESSDGATTRLAAAGARVVAVRAGVLLGVDSAAGRRVLLQDRSGGVLGSWSMSSWSDVPQLSLCADGRTVVGSGPDGFVVWRAGVEEPVLYFEGESYEQAPGEISPDGRFVLVGRNDGTVEFWGLESWEVERSLFAINEQGGRPTVVRWSADGEALYVGGARGGVVALQGRTGNPLWGDVLHEGPVTVLEPSAAGSWVLSADARTAALTAARGGEPLVRLAVGGDGSWAAFTVDGYHAAGGPDGARLLALRLRAAGAEPGRPGWTVVGAEDPDFAALGGAVDALLVTLLGAASSG
jgi:hypothetical protein